MSRRLVLGFVLVSLLLMAVLGVVRSFTLASELRQRQSQQVAQRAEVLAAVVEERRDSGQPVDRAFLSTLVTADGAVTYDVPGRPQVVALGNQTDDRRDADAVTATRQLDPGTLTVFEDDLPWYEILVLRGSSLVVLLVLITVTAGLAGYVVAQVLSAPFTRLAAAAAMLGRGRFDLDLPSTRIPEAQAVSAALAASATALRDRLAREQQFSVHASHVLRTPLTSLRLHLDELDGQDLGPDARAATERCLRSVDRLDQVAADLVDITRRGALMAGAEIPLRELATSSAQHWADVLIGEGRGFSAAVDGDLDLPLTPGPVEYVLDVLLEESQHLGEDEVRLVFQGDRDVLRIEVTGAGQHTAVPAFEGSRLEQAQSLVRSLGGHMEELPEGVGVRVLIPPR